MGSFTYGKAKKHKQEPNIIILVMAKIINKDLYFLFCDEVRIRLILFGVRFYCLQVETCEETCSIIELTCKIIG